MCIRLTGRARLPRSAAGTAYQISADAGVLTTTQPGGGVY
jgi:hypothetical protein